MKMEVVVMLETLGDLGGRRPLMAGGCTAIGR